MEERAEYRESNGESSRPRLIAEANLSELVDLKAKAFDLEGQLQAVHKTQAVIQFDLNGTVVSANDNFLKTVGYTLEEIKGRHHRIFCDSVYAASADYERFWANLNRGEAQNGEIKRVTKDGREVWLRAIYSPVVDQTGRVVKIVKFASDITAAKKSAEQQAQLRQMIDTAPINLMFCDLDLVIQYANEASVSTLRGLEKYMPIKADKLVGSTIDIFHKNPQHQRRMLADPKNLPHRADIELGPETLSLLVSAIMGNDGAAGAAEISAVGGTVIAQDPATAVIGSMPNAVINAGIVREIIPLAEMGRGVTRHTAALKFTLASRRRPGRAPQPAAAATPDPKLPAKPARVSNIR